MHTTITTTELRDDAADTLGRVRHAGERLVVTKNGKPTAAIISVNDLELLEKLEDQLDLLLARDALEGAKERGEKPVRWADVRARLGL